ncbi:MAG: 5-bromo-4-chloroindolyl phosphate hydrolysis family protein [Spirochaetes bacterium]|nr:5-bromo-4-chloroindolyl phosphate hydrolysis family protein [Spirochaetota bacterium]
MERKDFSEFSGIWAGGLGALAFVTTLLWGGTFVLAIGASIGVCLTSWVLLSPKKKIEQEGSSLSGDLQKELLSLGKRNVDEMAIWTKRIRDPRVRDHAEKIIALARKIIQEVEKDPKDIYLAKSFLNYHVRAVAKILRQYVELAEKTSTESSVQETLSRVEASLQQIAKAFEYQYEKLLSNDVLDLDAELKVLEQTIQMETDRKGGVHE